MLRSRVFVTVGVLALFATACTDSPQDSEAGAVLTEPPTVEILSPTDGAISEENEVTIRAAVDAFLVVDKLGEDVNPGEGHLHFYRDVEQIPTDSGQPAVIDDASKYAAVADLSYTWTDLESGTHTFAVQLVSNDHTPLDPPVVAQITMTVA